ncbi:MAG: sensor histidine kinase [Methanobacteriota archaeon]|nr:MAG: sensor histidine kinase [Euryarchaeota archaeon]
MLLAVVVILAGLTMYVLEEARGALVDSVGTESVHTAGFISTAVGRAIYHKYHEIWLHGSEASMQAELAKSNLQFDHMEDREAYLHSMNSEWVSTPPGETTPFMEGIMSNNISYYLRTMLYEHYIQDHGLSIYGNIAVVNKYGAVIAMVQRTMSYKQTDAPWWADALEHGHAFSDIIDCEMTNVHGVRVYAKLQDANGNFTGVAMALLDIVAISEEAVYFGRLYETTKMRIVTSDGRLIFSDGAFVAFDDVSDEQYFVRALEETSGYTLAAEGGRERLFSFTRSTPYLKYDGNDWIILVDHDASEVLAPVDDLSSKVLIASISIIGLAIGISHLFASSVSRRVRRLTDATTDLSKGSLDRRVDVLSSDELGQLANAFNSMATDLEVLYDNLELKVQERTAALEKASKKLQLLGSITRHDALNQISVVMGWLSVIEESLHDEKSLDMMRRVREAAMNIERYLEFTGTYERVGVKHPEWIRLDEALTISLFGLDPRQFQLHNGLAGLHVFGDPMLPRVLRNLVDNSIRHGGGITKASFTYERTPEGVVVVYEDDGKGIPDDMKTVIFERGLQAGRKSFGLYLSKEILSITDMSIREVGTPGEGARFEIVVPEGRYRIDREPVASSKREGEGE